MTRILDERGISYGDDLVRTLYELTAPAPS